MELRGLEPLAKIRLTCGNAELGDAQRRESARMTCEYVKGVDGVNSVSPAARLFYRCRCPLRLSPGRSLAMRGRATLVKGKQTRAR